MVRQWHYTWLYSLIDTSNCLCSFPSLVVNLWSYLSICYIMVQKTFTTLHSSSVSFFDVIMLIQTNIFYFFIQLRLYNPNIAGCKYFVMFFCTFDQLNRRPIYVITFDFKLRYHPDFHRSHDVSPTAWFNRLTWDM